MSSVALVNLEISCGLHRSRSDSTKRAVKSWISDARMFKQALNPFPNKPWLLRVCSATLLRNTMGKGDIARNKQYLLFPQCFLHIWRRFCTFHQIQKCRLQTLPVLKSEKFVVWGRIKMNSF